MLGNIRNLSDFAETFKIFTHLMIIIYSLLHALEKEDDHPMHNQSYSKCCSS
uniref:Uncharacterized protein n=1 Tax=Manihot esculenta TaxID=3983 RepID=A0A2C9UNN1_MANES